MDYVRETDQTQRIRAMARAVADHLTTNFIGKKHGGYNIYEDDRIYLELDTCVPNVRIALKRGGERVTVFSASYYHGMISCFHPGRWIGYLERLAERATAENAQAMMAEHERKQREAAAIIAPVDDADLFPEVA